MDRGLVTVIGMSIAYIASFIGLGLAWWAWKRRVEDDGAGDPPGDDDDRGLESRETGPDPGSDA